MNSWLCISCGTVLGEIVGGELRPDASLPGDHLITKGPNLAVTCPDCGTVKVFYTSDPVVRSLYQLVDAVARRAARSLSDDLTQKS